MPTPRPMRVHSWEVKPAIVIVFDRTPITDSAAVSAIPVESSGRSAARNDPKTKNSTTRAAATPKRVLFDDDGFVDAATSPRTSTCRLRPFELRAALTKLVASDAEMNFASLEKFTVANATVPLRLICLAPARL